MNSNDIVYLPTSSRSFPLSDLSLSASHLSWSLAKVATSNIDDEQHSASCTTAILNTIHAATTSSATTATIHDIAQRQLPLSNVITVTYYPKEPQPAGTRSFHQVLSCVSQQPTTRLALHSLQFTVGKTTKQPKYATTIFEFSSIDLATSWMNRISSALDGNAWWKRDKSKKLLVLVNPFSGTKMAPRYFKKYVEPMFLLANVPYEMKLTTEPKHATEIARNLDLNKYSGIVTVSGDGLFNEMINGLLTRPDASTAIRELPIAIIKGGTSNALAKVMDCTHPMLGAFNVIKGNQMSLDTFSVVQKQQGGDSEEKFVTHYGFLDIAWAFVTDVDFESEKLRWAGETRIDLWAAWRLISKRSYKAKLWYLNEPNPSLDQTKALLDSTSLPDGWKAAEETDFFFFIAISPPWVSSDFLVAPQATLNDGKIHLIWTPGATPSLSFLPSFLDQGSAEYLKSPWTHYEKVHAFILDPEPYTRGAGTDGKGLLGVDGEKIGNSRCLVTVMPSALRLVVPFWMDLARNEWKNRGQTDK